VQENFLETKNLIKIKYELNLEGHYFAGTKNIFNHKFSFVVAMYSVSLHNYLLFFEQAKMEYITTKRRPYLAQGVPKRAAVFYRSQVHMKKSLVNTQKDKRARPPHAVINT
jgi:hypothetical protein